MLKSFARIEVVYILNLLVPALKVDNFVLFKVLPDLHLIHFALPLASRVVIPLIPNWAVFVIRKAVYSFAVVRPVQHFARFLHFFFIFRAPLQLLLEILPISL